MPQDIARLEAGILALEAQRAALGDDVVDLALAPLRQRLAALQRTGAPVSLRQVTVLFADVVDFTRLARHLDPEDVGAVMDAVLARGTAVVVAHGGRVLQYAGDSILAVFGDDDAADLGPARAVQAALGLLALARGMAGEVAATHGIEGFDLRVGVHTGRVMLGGGIDDAGSIRGVTVNVAARLQQAAPPGGLLISHDTWWQVRGAFDAEPQPPLWVKGLDAPVRCLRVRRAQHAGAAAPTRGVEGVAVPMVGRDEELAVLLAAGDRLLAGGSGLRRVQVVGEAGAGKSRLLAEFLRAMAARPEAMFLFQARATPDARAQPHGLLRQMLASRYRLVGAESSAAAWRRLSDAVSPLFDDLTPAAAQSQLHSIGQLCGLRLPDDHAARALPDDPRHRQRQAFDAATQLLRRTAARGGAPLLMLLEDLHWADGASLDFLDHLAQRGRDIPLLMVGASRPEGPERRREAGGVAWDDALPLGALDAGHSLALVDALLHRLPDAPAALRERLVSGADGNPYFMEERVRMLIDAGGIVAGDGVWRLDVARSQTVPLPPTLTGVLQARLDGLPAPERLALQQAAVIGSLFARAALQALDPAAADALPALCRRGLLVRQASAGGLTDFSFCHQLMQQVAYDTLPKAERRQAHATVARWLAAQCDDDGAAGQWGAGSLAAVAAHFDLAGEAVPAAEYFARAAEQAGQTFAHQALLGHAERGLALAAEGASDLRWRLHAARERTLNYLGRRDAQRQDLLAMQSLADALDDDLRRAEVAWRRCDMALHTSDFATQETEARRALALARGCGDDTLAMRAIQRLAMALAHRGRAAEGLAMAEAAVQQARAQGRPDLECRLANAAALCASERGEQDVGLRYCQRSLALARELGLRSLEAVELGNVGMGLVYFGDYDGARGWLERAVAMEREVGNRKIESADLSMLAELCIRQGEAEAALTHARQALAIAREVQAPLYQCEAACALGAAHLALGQHDAAGDAFAEAEQVGQAIPHESWVLNGLEGKVRAAWCAGHTDLALALAERLAELAAVVPSDKLAAARQHRIRLTLVQVWAGCGDPRAGPWLVRAREALRVEAQRIGDKALRRSFLAAVEEHREILAGADASEGADGACPARGLQD